ncbi:phage holin family protein [Candidatus Uhrbacteria bacterium]|nr:phage holin family protein [Candidatus Uhrbacteria bacterium]
MTLILRWVLNALALLIAANLIPGFEVASFYAALIAALVLGFMNALVRPLILLLTLPVTVLTLGLFVFVVNALMLWLVSTIVKGVTLDGFGAALLTSLFLWAFGMVTNWFVRQTQEK